MDSADRLPSYAEIYRLAFSPERYGKQIAAAYADDDFYQPRLRELSAPQSGLTPAMVRRSCREQCRGVLPSSIRVRGKAQSSEQGALEGLTRMPVDILYEVCACSQRCAPTSCCLLARCMMHVVRELFVCRRPQADGCSASKCHHRCAAQMLA
jgi:hypothetical protein